jgi:hypothetical protein
MATLPESQVVLVGMDMVVYKLMISWRGLGVKLGLSFGTHWQHFLCLTYLLTLRSNVLSQAH